MAAPPASAAPFASLAEWLRARTDAQLAELLAARPDLTLPAPADFATLASRIAVRSSLHRAVDGLDAFTLRVLEALVQVADANGLTDLTAAAARLALGLPELDRPATVLITRGLAWGDSPRLRLVPGVADAVGTETPQSPESPDAPHADGPVQLAPAELELVRRDPAEHDRLGATTVLEAVRLVEALGAAWTRQPPSQLRSGGLAVRDLRRTAAELGLDETATAVVVETAAAAGLVNSSGGAEPTYLPTPDFDTWRTGSPQQRWSHLATAWLAMTRQPALVGERDERGRTRSALGPDIERGTAPVLRAALLDELATLPPGCAPADRDAFLAHLAWQAPRRAAVRAALTRATLAEADLLGVTAAGGLTGYSRTLRVGSRTVAEQVLAGALPEPVDHFFVQPDLTAVVPGPPAPDLAGDLDLVADLESTGGASVYRFTPSSVRRALDAGRSAEELREFVAHRSRTPLPQALGYLIDDVARRHGTLRAGAASSYLRSSDGTLLTRVLADRAMTDARLHRIAPEVAISPLSPPQLLNALRAAGYVPAAESPLGEVIALDRDQPRAPSRPPTRPVHTRRPVDDERELTEIVHRIRRGDGALRAVAGQAPVGAAGEPGRPGQPATAGATDRSERPAPTPTDTMALLREAVRGERRVRLGCSSSDGTIAHYTIVPYSVAAGVVRGRRPGSEDMLAFPVQRLTELQVLPEGAGEDDIDLR